MSSMFNLDDTNITESRELRVRNRLIGDNKRPSQIHLRGARFVVAGGYNDQVRRPFEFNVDDSDIQSIVENTSAGRYISEVALASTAANVIRPSADYEDYVNITEGWGAPRCRFVLEFCQDQGMGGNQRRWVYIGYTDHVGITVDGLIAPEMELNITAVIELRDATRFTNAGRETFTSLVAYDQVLVGDMSYDMRHADQFRSGTSELFTMAPKDVFMNVQVESEVSSYRFDSYSPSHSRIPRKAVRNRRNNNVSANYLKTVLETARNAEHASEMTNEQTFEEAIANVSENTFSKDPLWNIFGQETDISRNARITWEDLERFYPETQDPNIVMVSFPDMLRGVNNRNMGSYVDRFAEERQASTEVWNNRTTETVLATMITQQLPVLMMRDLIMDIRFHVTNEVRNNIDGYHWTIGDPRGTGAEAVHFVVDGLPPQFTIDCVQNFQRSFEMLIMQALTQNNAHSLSIMVDARCDGDIFLSISFDGKNPVDYLMPTFADSKASSIITSDLNRYQSVTLDVDRLSRSVLNF